MTGGIKPPPALGSVLLAAVPLLWPAILNRYPILFSDTGGFLSMGLQPSIGWDKPFVYGPLIAALSLRLSLVLPAIAQAILTSFVLWQTQAIWAKPRRSRHLALCLILAAITPIAWFTSTLMPDALTPIVCLALLVAQFRRSAAAVVIAAIAIAAHLSNLILAAALIAALALLTRAVPWRPLLSLALACAALLATNAVAYHRLAISPYGAVFALARLVADGPARDELDRACPSHPYVLCRWRDRLTSDSDQFLWDPNGPFWADPTPLPQFAAEASQLVFATIRAEPAAVLRDAYRNTVTQFLLTSIGDTLTNLHLAATVRPQLLRWFPDTELERFEAARQQRNELDPLARVLNPLYGVTFALAMSVAAILLLVGLRYPSPRADLAALILVALASNAFATGALSGPHPRYQARIAWLIVLPALIPVQPQARALSGSAIRTRSA